MGGENDVLESHTGFKHSVSNKGFYKKSNEEKKFKNHIKVKGTTPNCPLKMGE